MDTSKRFRLHNHLTNTQYDDKLHQKAIQNRLCPASLCSGSVMRPKGLTDEGLRSKEDKLRHAKDFIEQFFSSIKRLNSEAHETRWKEVEESIKKTGTYDLTGTELTYGAKLAWRNAPRCIGRIQWSKLQVFDCRYLTTTKEMFQALCNHIKYSTNKGYIRSAITIFPQRTDGKHDFRVWNPQLLMYAGYRNEDGSITGDPANVEFTEVCIKLGWRGNGGMFDILPLVLSANGEDPEFFHLPDDMLLEVKITHPTYKWFEDLGLKWYAVPAVSSMMFDCGGIQFPGAPFNGWYMSTEIACRDFCDLNRYNITEKVAQKMGLDTSSNTSLWKDKAVLEVNVAVIYSFQKQNVTIVDHHTASETFMKHCENEQRLRNGIPGDWVWIVPPMTSHLTSVYHQELANYFLFPAYLYQGPAWKVHEWKGTNNFKKENKKLAFKSYASIAKVTSKMFGSALSKRIKATILYATETGKSEIYAKQLSEMFSHAFHPKVCRMDEYDVNKIEHETILLIVASTFGNGDPPENGQMFANHLHSLTLDESNLLNGHREREMFKTASFIKANSIADASPGTNLDRCDSTRSSVADEIFGVLSTVRFAVFGLGSSAYPNFCSFGSFVDKILGDLGGERIFKFTKGDELCGQEQTFKNWAREVFKVACNEFCLDYEETLGDVAKVLDTQGITESTCQFVEAEGDTLINDLSKFINKPLWECPLLNKRNLLGEDAKSKTLNLEIGTPEDLKFEPGDHVGIFPQNRKELVEGIIRRVDFDFDPDQTLQLQFLIEKRTPNGVIKNWIPHERLPTTSLRVLLSRFLDITTPASPALLKFLSTYASDPQEKERLIILATDARAYDDWKYFNFPHLLEVLEEFASVRIKAELLVSQLRPLQPRFYSISSAPSLYSNQVHLTAAVVQYHAQDGKGPLHYGVASNYLHELNVGDKLYLYARRALNFHLPEDITRPVIMIGPGTGIAPFRGFWQHRKAQRCRKSDGEFGNMTLFFGCRSKSFDLYQKEKAAAINEGVLSEVHLALSRDPSMPKTYVQDLMRKSAEDIYSQLVIQKGHFYVCGDCSMAEDVLRTLKDIFKVQGNLSDDEVENYIFYMRDKQRYHEDIFGITLRTAEVQTKSRAKINERYHS